MSTETCRKKYPANRKSRAPVVLKKWKLVFGIGINDNPEPTSHTSTNPVYRIWLGMLARCYGKRGKYPHHAGCCVDPRWHSFVAFNAWVGAQVWEVGYCLDKDILFPGNRLYSPETCVFISPHVNAILNTNPKVRGQLPIGVAKSGKKFAAQCNLGNGSVHLGVFETKELAHKKWQSTKADFIMEIADKQNDERVRNRLIQEAAMLMFEHDNDVESVR